MLGALRRARAQLLHTGGEPVARALELPQIEQRRPGRSRSRARCDGDGDVGEPLGDDPRQLPLQACYLSSQRVPGGALGGLGAAPEQVWASLDDAAIATADDRPADWIVPLDY